MKRTLTLLLTIVMLMACFSAVAAHAASYIYISGHTYVRTGPGESYASIGIINKGSTLPYLNQASYDYYGNVWYKVSFTNTYGWVSSDYTYPTDYAVGPNTYGDGGDGGSYGTDNYYSQGCTGTVYITATVNVRTGPGLNYKSIGNAVKGNSLTYLGSTSNDSRGIAWYMVSFKGGTGWVSSTFATLNSYSGSSSSSGSSYYGSYVKATSGDTNLRTGPGLNYSDIGTMFKGESATYLGSTSYDSRGVAWHHVSFEGKTGWVSSRYTTLY